MMRNRPPRGRDAQGEGYTDMPPRKPYRILSPATALAVAFLVSSCSTPSVPPAEVEQQPPSAWETYRPAATRSGSATWGVASRDPRGEAVSAPGVPDSVARAPLSPPPAARQDKAPDPVPVADGGRPVARATEVISRWADGYVGEGFRAEFDEAVGRAAVRGLAEAEEKETGNVYAFTRIALKEAGCATVEVTVMSPGRTLPVLSRGTASACRR